MFECNVTLQCITQHNSWPGSAQLTSSAQPAWPAPSPGLAWSLSSEVNIQQGNNILYSLHRKFFYLIFMLHILPDHQKRSSTLTLLSLVGFSVCLCRCVWYPCRESRYKWRTLLRSGAFHPFYAKFLSWESPGVSVHRRLVLATEVTVILCYPWLNPDLDSCPSQCRRKSDKMAPAVDTLVAMTDAFEGIDRLAEGAPKTDGAPNFRRVSILYLRICRD